MSETISISNGSEFYTIPVADLAAAKGDGFYVPAERGLTIVSNGDEVFEIPLADVPAAEADGFRDLLAAERANGRPSAIAPPPPPVAPPTVKAPPVEPKPRKPERPARVAAPVIDVPIDTHEEERLQQLREREAFLATLGTFPRLTTKARFWWEDHHAEVKQNVRDYGVSAALNGLAMLFMFLWAFEQAGKKPEFQISSAISDADTPADEPLTEQVEMNLDPSLETSDMPDAAAAADIVSLDVSDQNPATDVLDMLSNAPGPEMQILGELGGRTQAGKEAALLKYGGTMASERAVNESLKWLSRHQLPDGGWSYAHTAAAGCDCSEPGSFDKGRLSATGLALLTYLGAGHTAIDGAHAKVVKSGTEFLMRNGKLGEGGTFDLRSVPGSTSNEGIYEHAISTTALCESLALVRAQLEANPRRIKLSDGRSVDRRIFVTMEDELSKYATAAIKWLVVHQDSTGGWTYVPDKPGGRPDTSIQGWCMMALISGRNAGIDIPEKVFSDAHKYLDSVALEGGAFYGYAKPERKNSTTGIGLLVRMYHGWKRDDAPLKKGIAHISNIGPSPNDMYFNYYATQAMHHWEGDEWTRWNLTMREQLVNSQVRSGHEAGSWNVADAHGAKGGRLYMTCLATMTLEVYYRHLPIYRETQKHAVASKN